jgi:hypothetical protein
MRAQPSPGELMMPLTTKQLMRFTAFGDRVVGSAAPGGCAFLGGTALDADGGWYEMADDGVGAELDDRTQRRTPNC